MIRQLGTPTWFATFSAADTKWPFLRKILGRLIDKKYYTEEEIREMSWNHVPDILALCSNSFLMTVLKALWTQLETEDYFYRIEFLHGGSPHSHALIWIKHAPQYGKDSNEKIIEFVDKYVTCKLDKSNDMKELVNLQLHRHAKTCPVNGKHICAFNFPVPLMRKTIILMPLPTDLLTDEVTEHKKTMESLLKFWMK